MAENIGEIRRNLRSAMSALGVPVTLTIVIEIEKLIDLKIAEAFKQKELERLEHKLLGI